MKTVARKCREQAIVPLDAIHLGHRNFSADHRGGNAVPSETAVKNIMPDIVILTIYDNHYEMMRI